MDKFVVIGTDTDIGKTYVSCLLLSHFQKEGFTTAALKPVACGTSPEGLNDDVEQLQAVTSPKQKRQHINPICYAPFCSPHIAAEKAQESLTVARIIDACQDTLNTDTDKLLVEGCGGYFVPLNETETMADFVKQLGLPVVFVVGMRLGCLNHALLTAQALQNDGISCHGWIANSCQGEMEFYQENLETLRTRLPFPLIAEVAFNGRELQFV